MNALLELKLLHPRKTMNCLQPSLITGQEKSFGFNLCFCDCMALDEMQKLRIMLVVVHFNLSLTFFSSNAVYIAHLCSFDKNFFFLTVASSCDTLTFPRGKKKQNTGNQNREKTHESMLLI